MKTSTHAISTHTSGFGFLILAACLLFAPAARAGLTVDMHLYNNNNSFFAFPLLSTNTVTSNNPSNTYFVSSPMGGIHGELDAGSTFSQAGSGDYGDLGSLIHELTNGNWTLLITNTLSTNQYSFTVSVTGVTSNQFAPVVITFPTNGAVSITNTPTFAWQGPTNWQGTLNVNENFIDTNGNYYGEASAGLPASQTKWPCPVVLPDGTNNFSADYQSNVTALIVANIPTNNLVQPLSGWVPPPRSKPTITPNSSSARPFSAVQAADIRSSLITPLTIQTTSAPIHLATATTIMPVANKMAEALKQPTTQKRAAAQLIFSEMTPITSVPVIKGAPSTRLGFSPLCREVFQSPFGSKPRLPLATRGITWQRRVDSSVKSNPILVRARGEDPLEDWALPSRKAFPLTHAMTPITRRSLPAIRANITLGSARKCRSKVKSRVWQIARLRCRMLSTVDVVHPAAVRFADRGATAVLHHALAQLARCGAGTVGADRFPISSSLREHREKAGQGVADTDAPPLLTELQQ